MIEPRPPSGPESAAAAADLAHREDPYHVTQASRIYFLPNLMTAGNLFCGFMAIVHCIQARLAELRVPTYVFTQGQPLPEALQHPLALGAAVRG